MFFHNSVCNFGQYYLCYSWSNICRTSCQNFVNICIFTLHKIVSALPTSKALKCFLRLHFGSVRPQTYKGYVFHPVSPLANMCQHFGESEVTQFFSPENIDSEACVVIDFSDSSNIVEVNDHIEKI